MSSAPIPLPCFSYQRSALFTDDNKSHITTMTIELDLHLPYSAFSDPRQVLHYIQTHGRPNKTTSIETYYLEIQNPSRFKEPSLLIADYAMPGTNMNGFELCAEVKKLCKQLNITPPKIILLSGQAGEDIAKEGFNKGYIDKYISKNDRQCGKKLDEAIQELQLQFSMEKSSDLLQDLSVQPDFCLNDPHFVQLFNQICKDNKIIEHYLLSRSGDFLLSQVDGSILWLVVIPEGVKENNNKKTYIPFLKALKGEHTTYHYCLVKEPDLAPIQRDKIVSLKHYIEDIWSMD